MCTQNVDKINTIGYNICMQHKYRIFKIKGQKFIVKMDLNPLTNEFEYHMYIRHLVMPEQAIAAYFSRTTDIYNKERDRNELYSKDLNITVYYKHLEPDILLITAFYEGGTDDKI